MKPSLKNTRLLLVTQVFYPDEVSTANLFTELSVELNNHHEINVKVWCSQPSYSTSERQVSVVRYKGFDICYLPSTSFSKTSKIGRLINYLTFSLSVILKFIFSRDIPTVITHTTPPSLGVILSFLCKIKKTKLIYVLLDVFPDGLVKLGVLNEKSFITKLWQYINKGAFKRCYKIVVIGRDMQKWLINFYPGSINKCIYIPIWQKKELFKTVKFSENPFVIKYNFQNKFVVQYSGNMGLWNDMKTFAIAVNHEPEDVLFVFIGEGMRRKELVSSFKKTNPNNVLMFPFLSNNDYSYSISACHVALVSLQENLEGMAVPSKIMGIMAAGIPVIALVPENSEIAMIINEEECGIVIKPGNVDDLIKGIILLKNNAILRDKMGENGKRAFNQKYCLDVVSNQYSKIIKCSDEF